MNNLNLQPFQRRMRIRSSTQMRNLVSQVALSEKKLIQPIFVNEGIKEPFYIPTLDETRKQSIEDAIRQVEGDLERGVSQFLLFSVPQNVSSVGDIDYSLRVIRELKARFTNHITLWVDTCLCSLTADGHCCLYQEAKGNSGLLRVNLGETLKALQHLALGYAQAGADGIAPSDMIDGRVSAIRNILDQNHFDHIPVMSYSTKGASALYGPFRVAADSIPTHGDRRAYQIDPRNRDDLLASSYRCLEEGADLLLIKPGIVNLDLIAKLRETTHQPIGCYQVSGEYGALQALSEKGMVDLGRAILETWISMHRSGADFIVTYGARHAREWINKYEF